LLPLEQDFLMQRDRKSFASAHKYFPSAAVEPVENISA
jgi:hypothetical protein